MGGKNFGAQGFFGMGDFGPLQTFKFPTITIFPVLDYG